MKFENCCLKPKELSALLSLLKFYGSLSAFEDHSNENYLFSCSQKLYFGFYILENKYFFPLLKGGYHWTDIKVKRFPSKVT